MLAVFVSTPAPKDPLSVLEVGERPVPEAPEGWTTVTVKAVSLNHHDLFSLQGIGLPQERMPMILGTDAAGLDEDGNEVVVPRRNLLPKPADLSFAEAACLPTAWLTAYRMLFVKSGLRPGQTVLVQGASGGVATALIVLGRAAGYRVWVTGRSEEKRAAALALGAEQAFESGARLPERVDGVMETVGEATWSHSIKSLKPGGVLVTSGATTGFNPGAELNRVFFTQLSVIGSTMGTRSELESLIQLCSVTGIRPQIDVELPLSQARDGFERMLEGRTAGKIVFTL
ncbi:MAG: zinc-binding dehydrogenase [Blastococcus sp.]